METRQPEEHWHLAKNEDEAKFVNFEFLFWRTFYSWIRWQEDCQTCIADDDLTAYEVAVLHIIRTRSRAKTIYEISRLLNRDDTPNIQYCVKKLIDLGYVERIDLKDSIKKTVAYRITAAGIHNTNGFTKMRDDLLLKLVHEHKDSLNFEESSKTLLMMKSLYEEASRQVAVTETPTSLP